MNFGCPCWDSIEEKTGVFSEYAYYLRYHTELICKPNANGLISDVIYVNIAKKKIIA